MSSQPCVSTIAAIASIAALVAKDCRVHSDRRRRCWALGCRRSSHMRQRWGFQMLNKQRQDHLEDTMCDPRRTKSSAVTTDHPRTSPCPLSDRGGPTKRPWSHRGTRRIVEASSTHFGMKSLALLPRSATAWDCGITSRALSESAITSVQDLESCAEPIHFIAALRMFLRE